MELTRRSTSQGRLGGGMSGWKSNLGILTLEIDSLGLRIGYPESGIKQIDLDLHGSRHTDSKGTKPI